MRSIVIAASLAMVPLAAGAAEQHVLLKPDQVQWGPAPAILPQGAEIAVLAGDPFKAGAFVLRLRLPEGYRVPPHWHTRAENVSVLSGTFHFGMGNRESRDTATPLSAGGFAMMPGRMHHYAWCEGGCVVQVHGTGPFDLHYVNPADNPQRTASR